MGDGGSGGDPLNNGQDIHTLLGAMLRLDVDGGLPYAIPPDNPYVGVAGRDEIWAIGLRNPWRFSFDRTNGDLYIGDVGQNLWEEIDYQAADTPGGANFGWRCKEGTHDYSFQRCLPDRRPDRPDRRISPTARAARSPAALSIVARTIRPWWGATFTPTTSRARSGACTRPAQIRIHGPAPELELDTGLNISAFGEDENGELYVVDYGGTIRRLADVNGPAPDLSTSSKDASDPSADPARIVTYTIQLINTGGLVDHTVRLTDTLPPVWPMSRLAAGQPRHRG